MEIYKGEGIALVGPDLSTRLAFNRWSMESKQYLYDYTVYANGDRRFTINGKMVLPNELNAKQIKIFLDLGCAYADWLKGME